jgi:hypothetical protein
MNLTQIKEEQRRGRVMSNNQPGKFINHQQQMSMPVNRIMSN